MPGSARMLTSAISCKPGSYRNGRPTK